jgi:hypothetical protein
MIKPFQILLFGLPPSDATAAKATIKFDLAEVENEAAGKTIGCYKILEKVGEGGCGVAYVAEQTEPVRRRVALEGTLPICCNWTISFFPHRLSRGQETAVFD